MKTSRFLRRTLAVAALGLLLPAASPPARAGSATWNSHPTSGDWTTAANWMPSTVPNGTSDIATFGPSSITALSITNTNIDLGSAVFKSNAPPFTTTLQTSVLEDATLTLRGAGIQNNSGVMQSFVISSGIAGYATIAFYNNASAGEMTTFSITTAGSFGFSDFSSAGSATFNLTGGDSGGTNLSFGEGTTAANATINASGGAYVLLYSTTGGHATFNLTSPGFSYLQFGGASDAEHANINSIGAYGVLFLGTSSAGDAAITVDPANTTNRDSQYDLLRR